MNFLRTICRDGENPKLVTSHKFFFSTPIINTNLDSADIGVLSNVLVLVKTVLGSLALAKVDGQLNKQEHHRLEGGDGAATGALGGDMFVEDSQGGGRLTDGDEFLSPLWKI
jgi:hypothetical protein